MADHLRLTSSSDIRDVFAARLAAGTTHVVAHARLRDVDDGSPRAGDRARVAVVAGKRVGNAVTRNRAKRRIRASIQAMTVPSGVDIVVTAKAGAHVAPSAVLWDEVSVAVQGATRRARRPRP